VIKDPVSRTDLALVIIDITGALLAVSDALQASAEGDQTRLYTKLNAVIERVQKLHKQYDRLIDDIK
jgi:hypothetical protein